MKDSNLSDFTIITEAAGQKISLEQLDRSCHRYYWALPFCEGKDVLEVACGAGQGLGLLASRSRTLAAGDISEDLLAEAQKVSAAHGDKKISLGCFPAEHLPFEDGSFDTLLLFEAIYYLDAKAFMGEAARVLRPGGHLLIVTANPALADFNPSPFSTSYYNSEELRGLCHEGGFAPQCAGYVDISSVSLRQRILRPVKWLAVRFGLIPNTMKGKEWLKKLFFGKMTVMPPDLSTLKFEYEPPAPISSGIVDRRHKVIYCQSVSKGRNNS